MATDDEGTGALPVSGAGGEALGPPGPVPEIEGYQILGPLGEGGMGTVWRAVQKSTRREVALKLLGRGAFGSEKDRLRFEREVELAARLEHPHIARVYDSGLHQGVCYYAMELVEGLPLDNYVEQNHLDRRQILQLMRTICEAVQHAHQRGVIHRDLKPRNIFVTPDGQPHVLDFGLAKAFLEGQPEVSISMEGEVAGTPAFMSPEQAAGKIDHLDTRSDVYSLGVVLYRLLTGDFPHDLSGTRYELLKRIAEEEARRPRAAAKDLDKELEALLLKALAHDPEGRYDSAGDLADDINNYLTGEPLAAKTPTTTYFLRKRLLKHRVPVALGCLALAASIGFAALDYVRVAYERDRAVQAERKAEEAKNHEGAQRLEAERLARLANAQRLAAQSVGALDRDPQLSLRLAVETLETTLRHGEPRVPEAEQALRDALARVRSRPLHGHEADIYCVAISPDGRWLVTGGFRRDGPAVGPDGQGPGRGADCPART